jgi:hypothetical protein
MISTTDTVFIGGEWSGAASVIEELLVRESGKPRAEAREVKKLGRPATTPHLVDWSRKTVGISAEIERVETRAHAGSWVRCPVLRPVARM